MQPVATLHPATLAAEFQPNGTLAQHVNHAFRHYHSILALSRSPLAGSALVAPALIRDAVSPTADERGHALRLLLQWAVGLLAPEPQRYPFGTERPYDDPTWRDPRWWRYNILRHRYLEPLHPDEFVEGGRYTETLLALTGIPSADTLFEERNRAIREIADWLQAYAVGDGSNNALQQLALDDTLRPLQEQPAARTLLDIAATFDSVFTRALLLQIAAEEHVVAMTAALATLTLQRLLRTDEVGNELWLSPLLRAYLYRRQPAESLQRRHRQIARHYESSSAPLEAATHWQRAGQWERAARILFAAAPGLVHELQIGELRDALLAFRQSDLPAEQWREVQILLSDLAVRLGQREAALIACRRALKVAHSPLEQAQIFRRMGKLYEQHNQPLALHYYQQATALLPANDPNLVTLLKDRAWLYILRREWPQAEADLAAALERAAAQPAEIRADIYDALASLNREQKRFERAVEYARGALALREELGSLPRIADSLNNLGLLYSATGDQTPALATFNEALVTYRKIDNQERTAGVLLNVGMVHHLAGRRRAAIGAYQECCAIAAERDLRLIHARALGNLAEAYAELAESDEARRHWQLGCDLSRAAGFDDELAYFNELRERFPLLQTPLAAMLPNLPAEKLEAGEGHPALALARRDGAVTAKILMEATGVSKATATRQLAELVRRGALQAQGKGRSTLYLAATSTPVIDITNLPGVDDATLAAVVPLLHAQAHWLANDYHITTLGVGPQRMCVPLVAHFAQPPDLQHFFEVERRLSAQLGIVVDLQLGGRAPLLLVLSG